MTSQRSHFWWLLIAYLAAFPLLFRPTLGGSDPLGYYAWVRSAVIDHDLNVDNEFRDLGFDAYQQVTTATGYRYNHWSAGPALLWLPWYAAAHALVLLAQNLGAAWAADGYTAPYTVAASFASTVYALAGIAMLYDIARRLTPSPVAALAVITVWFASPLLFYMYSHPLMSHAVDFAANALVVWVWVRTRQDKLAGMAGARGSIGLAVVIRPQNGLLLLFPSIELLMRLGQNGAPFQQRMQQILGHGSAFALGLLFFLLPQMVFWRIVYGHWIYNSYAITYAIEGTVLDLTRPHLLELAFSNNHGLFVWSPALLPGLIGLLLLFRQDRRLAAFLLLNVVLQYYLLSSLSTWHGGGPSFGARYLIGTLPAFALGMAALYGQLARRIDLRALAAASALFAVWNLLLIVQYVLELVPRSGPMDVATMVQNQLRVVPDNLLRILRLLFNRAPA